MTKSNDRLISEPDEISNLFNNYFSNIAVSLSISSNITESNCEIMDECTGNASSEHSFLFELFTPLEVHKIIQSLKNSNSRSCDDVSTNITKNISYLVSDVLSNF